MSHTETDAYVASLADDGLVDDSVVDDSVVDDMEPWYPLGFAPKSPIDAAANALAQMNVGEVALLEAAWDFVQDVVARDGDLALDPQAWQTAAPVGGEGTPVLILGTEEEFGVPLGMSARAADRLLSEAAELVVRLPLVWARLRRGMVSPKRARFLAKSTQVLPAEAAAWVDAHVELILEGLSFSRIVKVVEEAQVRFGQWEPEPEETLHHVTIAPQPARGVSFVSMCVDSDDAERFDRALSAVAGQLKALGDASSLEARRARAVGVLASPQQCLDLFALSADEAERVRAEVGPVDPRLLAASGSLPVMELIVRVDAASLEPSAPGDSWAVARTDRLGAQAVDVIRRWIGHHRVVVKPVVDVAATRGVDSYEIPASLRRAVIESHPTCVFPWCQRRAEQCDLDHIEPFDHATASSSASGSPPQTRFDNLAPLCRKHHVLKTHRGWSYERDQIIDAETHEPLDIAYFWTSPQGDYLRVDCWGTALLDTPHPLALLGT